MEGDQKILKNQSFSKDQHSVPGFPDASLGLWNFVFLSFFGHLQWFLLVFSSPGFEFIGFLVTFHAFWYVSCWKQSRPAPELSDWVLKDVSILSGRPESASHCAPKV